jgi:hypothetical protein
VPTTQVATLEVKLPGIEVLNPGKIVRVTRPTDPLENVGTGVTGVLLTPLGAGRSLAVVVHPGKGVCAEPCPPDRVAGEVVGSTTIALATTTVAARTTQIRRRKSARRNSRPTMSA